MAVYFLAALAGCLLTIILTPLVRRLAIKHQAIDQPGDRHIHQQPTPRWGGLAIASGFWLIIIAIWLFRPDKLIFSDWQLGRLDANLLGVFLGSIILVIVGALDDRKSLSPAKKFCWQLIAALIVAVLGIKIWWISNPFGGLNWDLGNLTYLLVPLWIILMINVINWLDGLDGLASSVGLISTVILFFLAIKPVINQPAMALLAAVFAGCLVGFLPYNLPSAKIFLGDAGSLFLGFILAVFAIISGAKLATAALVMGIPILDALWVIGRRLKNRQPLWQGDSRHLHHRLREKGWPATGILIFYCSLTTVFGIIGLTGNTRSKFWGLLLLLTIMIIIGLWINYFSPANKKMRK